MKNIFIFTMLLLSGCAISSQPVSTASIDAPGWKKTKECYFERCGVLITVIDGPPGRIAVKSHNAEGISSLVVFPFPMPLENEGARSNNEIFPVTVRFGVGMDYVKINPNTITLKFKEKSPLIPIAYMVREDTGGCILRKYKNLLRGYVVDSDSLYDFILTKEGEKIVVKKNTCIDFIYDITPPNPEEEFHMNLVGVYSEGAELQLPLIRFSK